MRSAAFWQGGFDVIAGLIDQHWNSNLFGRQPMSNVFESQHPWCGTKLSRLRDKNTDPKRFRELVREIAALMVYEATADLTVVPREIETPLARMTAYELKDKIGLVPILRAWPGDGGRHLGTDAAGRSLAHRPVP